MPDITAVLDEYAVNQVLPAAQAAVGTLTHSGSMYFFPCNYTYTVSGSFSGGTAYLTPPNKVQLAGFTLHYSLYLLISLDLSDIIPDIHIPPLGPYNIGFFTIYIPPINFNWPTITLPLSYSDTATVTTDCTLSTSLAGPDWHVDLVVQSISQLNVNQAAAAILLLIGAAVGPALVGIPLIGPFVGAAILGITTAIGIGGVLNLLNLMLTPLVAGAAFRIYNQPQHFPLMAVAGPNDPTVYMDLDLVTASVVNLGEPELVIYADVSP